MTGFFLAGPEKIDLARKPRIISHSPDFLKNKKIFLNFMGIFYKFSLLYVTKGGRFCQKLCFMMSNIKI